MPNRLSQEVRRLFQVATSSQEVLQDLRMTRVPYAGWCVVTLLTLSVITPTASEYGRDYLIHRVPFLANQTLLGNEILHFFGSNPAVIAAVGLWLQGCFHGIWRPVSWFVESGHAARLWRERQDRGVVATFFDTHQAVALYLRREMKHINWWSEQTAELLKIVTWMMTAAIVGVVSVVPPLMALSSLQEGLISWRFYETADGKIDDHLHSQSIEAIMNNFHLDTDLAVRCEIWRWFLIILQISLVYLATQVGSRATCGKGVTVSDRPHTTLYKSLQSHLLRDARSSEQELKCRGSAPATLKERRAVAVSSSLGPR